MTQQPHTVPLPYINNLTSLPSLSLSPNPISRKTMSHFTEPTTSYWQEILSSPNSQTPWQFGYPAKLPDSRFLILPIRPMKDNPKHAVASLLVNQASMDVVDLLADFLADLVRPFEPDVLIGLPTLGLSLAPIVARKLSLSMLHHMFCTFIFKRQERKRL